MVCKVKVCYLFLILTLTCTEIASKHSLLGNKSSKTKCVSDEDCPFGFQCFENRCQCDEENGCKLNADRAKSSVIGGHCAEDEDCNVEHAHCNERQECACKEKYVAASDKRKCLKVAGGLGQPCTEDVQCMEKVKEAICSKGKCECDEIHHRNKLKCLRNRDIEGACTKDEDCSNIANSECKVVKCMCVTGYVPSVNKKHCLAEANATNPECEEDSQCVGYLGEAGICKENLCDCDELHVIDDSTCQRVSKLKDPCETDADCSHATNNTMYCENGKCECLLPYEEENGNCNSAQRIGASLGLFLSLLHILRYMH